MKQMFWGMRCGDEEGVVRSECKMKDERGEGSRGNWTTQIPLRDSAAAAAAAAAAGGH